MGKRESGLKDILYRLRRKGVRCDTKARVIECPYGKDPMRVRQIRRLVEEYRFNIQFIIS